MTEHTAAGHRDPTLVAATDGVGAKVRRAADKDMRRSGSISACVHGAAASVKGRVGGEAVRYTGVLEFAP